MFRHKLDVNWTTKSDWKDLVLSNVVCFHSTVSKSENQFRVIQRDMTEKHKILKKSVCSSDEAWGFLESAADNGAAHFEFFNEFAAAALPH